MFRRLPLSRSLPPSMPICPLWALRIISPRSSPPWESDARYGCRIYCWITNVSLTNWRTCPCVESRVPRERRPPFSNCLMEITPRSRRSTKRSAPRWDSPKSALPSADRPTRARLITTSSAFSAALPSRRTKCAEIYVSSPTSRRSRNHSPRIRLAVRPWRTSGIQ